LARPQGTAKLRISSAVAGRQEKEAQFHKKGEKRQKMGQNPNRA